MLRESLIRRLKSKESWPPGISISWAYYTCKNNHRFVTVTDWSISADALITEHLERHQFLPNIWKIRKAQNTALLKSTTILLEHQQCKLCRLLYMLGSQTPFWTGDVGLLSSSVESLTSSAIFPSQSGTFQQAGNGSVSISWAVGMASRVSSWRKFSRIST